MKNAAKWRGQLRHILTTGGGILAAFGYITPMEAAQGADLAMTAGGGVMALAGFVWSFFSKDKLIGNGDIT